MILHENLYPLFESPKLTSGLMFSTGYQGRRKNVWKPKMIKAASKAVIHTLPDLGLIWRMN